jgi:phytol kinase
MNNDWLIILKLSALFLLLFGTAELLHLKFGIKAELTRKMVHIGTGLLTLLFPLYLDHLWQAIVICAAFLILLTLSLRFRFLKSINAVSRKTSGSILYPVIIIVVFAAYQYFRQIPTSYDKLLYFYMPVLTMAICDPLAALSGTWYQRKHNAKAGKTFLGSLVFFLSAIAVAYTCFSFFSKDTNSMTSFIYSCIIALLAAATERISNKGWDNFTIPSIVLLFLFSIEFLSK